MTGRTSLAAVVSVALALLAAAPASAQTEAADKWKVEFSPLYLWASELDGRVSAGDKSMPIYMSFSDAAKQLAGTFTVHVEARRNRWGMLGDFTFVRLSTDTTFTAPALQRTVDGSIETDMLVFEAAASYLVLPEAPLAVIGGLRTYTFGADLEFDDPVGGVSSVDESRTATSAFGGFTYRPKLSEKWTLLARGDLGVGTAFTWSATLGFDYRMKPWGSFGFGFRALGIDTGDAGEGTGEIEYDVTHYGPMVGMTLHFNQK